MSEDEQTDGGIDLGKYLNGNPAMREIWDDALERIEAGKPLPEVQAVVAREWRNRARASLDALELLSRYQALSEAQEAERYALAQTVEKIDRSVGL